MFKSVGSTWILNVLQIASVLLISPFVIARLGDGPNGVWVTIVSLTGLLGLLVLGIPMASVRFVAEAVARGDRARKDAAVSTCLAITLALGAAALCVGGVLGWAFEARYLRGELVAGLDPATISGARAAFAVVVLQVALGFAMRLPHGILDAHGDFVARNAVMAGEIAFRFAATLAVLSVSPSLPALALVVLASSLVEFAAAMVVLKRRHPDVRFSLAAYDRTLVRGVLAFSVWALLLNVGALLAFRVDALVIGAFLPAEAATQFDVANKFFEPLTSLVVAVSAVILPHATKLHALGAASALRADFLKWSKICLSLVLAVGLYLLVLGPAFLGAWVGQRFVEPSGPVLQVLMLSFLVWLPVRGVAIAVLFGLGRPRKAALAFLGLGVVNLVVSVLLVGPLGILGVALGTAVPNVVFALYVLVLAAREVGVGLGEYAVYVAGRAALGALAPLGFLLAVRHLLDPRGMPALLGTGALMLVVFAAAWILFVYRNDPLLDLRALLRRSQSAREGSAR
ncbi:MAG: polysaccharide biosynthesis C-terminal domain-containing protein [Planctomycetes bacterium]|nr:polysaccharide biosynthesis C-terminal domain-containing protein [Planctomycetota bacterium]